MTPTSLPVTPAQPDQDTYGPTELALFKQYNYETYLAGFGVEPPPFDPAYPAKYWFDSSIANLPPDDFVLYRQIVTSANGPQCRQLALKSGVARKVNIPHKVSYPAYVVPPTTAMRANGLLRPETLSLEADAIALIKELGITAELTDQGRQWDSTSFPTIYGDEPRRVWEFIHKGQVYNVGAMLADKGGVGVGSPGRWYLPTQENSPLDRIDWMPDPAPVDGLNDSRDPIPVPVRELLPNEKLTGTLMGVVIVRTDRMAANQAGANAGSVGGGFTDSDRAVQAEILKILKEATGKA